MILHDLIKIKYIQEGYLPNYPYHLVSDKEMFEAFTKEGGYFDTNYPNISNELLEQYNVLKDYIYERIDMFQTGLLDALDDWVYAYMFGEVISINSPSDDIVMLYNFFNMDIADNTDLSFNEDVSENCYSVSDTWLKKLSNSQYRPPCMFGEPHVIKSLRLNQVSIV